MPAGGGAPAAESNPMLTPREAARLLGISYATIKQWILSEKLATQKTPGGHHRISEAALAPFLADNRRQPGRSRERFQRVSGRNQIIGHVVEVRIEGLLAQVRLRVADQHITAIITADAAREMKLKKGDQAAALVKATEVMVERI